MNGFSKKLQGLDTEIELGKRKIELSKYKYLLDEFQLNRIHTFASILRIAPFWEIKRATQEARVEIPYINTDIHLVNPGNLPFFRIIVSLGIVSDMCMNVETKVYVLSNNSVSKSVKVRRTDWYSTNRVIDAQEILLNFDAKSYQQETDDFSLVLGIGVEFGKPGFDNQPVEVKRAGCAKILGVK